MVRPDLRGHGQSDAPERAEDYAADRYVEDVERLADAVGAERFSVWGFSLGATMGLQLAARSSRLLRAVIAGSHFGPIFTREMLQRSVDRLGELIEQERAGTLDPAALSENERTVVAQGRLAATRAWLRAAPDWPPLAPSSLRCPTLVYAGTEDFVARRLEVQADEIRRAGVRLELLPGLDHFQEVTRGDVVLPLARSFLSRPGATCVTSRSIPCGSPSSPARR